MCEIGQVYLLHTTAFMCNILVVSDIHLFESTLLTSCESLSEILVHPMSSGTLFPIITPRYRMGNCGLGTLKTTFGGNMGGVLAHCPRRSRSVLSQFIFMPEALQNLSMASV